ncbi:hypothetical protein [Planctomycetes bacterium Pan216]
MDASDPSAQEPDIDPESFEVSPELWLAVREAAATSHISISQFIAKAFQAESRRINLGVEEPLPIERPDPNAPEADRQTFVNALAERALRHAVEAVRDGYGLE